ncbi:citrate lyase holo-[acyl-carrier protein] synthase [Photobacterium toruni]|uniref:citrate lyase holo-[acyl-carrier protein] synthase n=1 Tax=Photobacterium toruni TaxID=1935446 RepID=A0ABU6LFA8_9GAMM|nr:citrate lyase holo-[acyl-carrier protein] synthase [Photobacterium toruni]
MFEGVSVNLMDIMAFRDAISNTHKLWLDGNAELLISFTVNMMGPVKVNQATRRIFQQGIAAIEQFYMDTSLIVLHAQRFESAAGFHYVVAVSGRSSLLLKKQLIELELSLPYGRMMDIDVIDKSYRPVSRRCLGYAPRQCLICHQQAKDCARNQTHSLADLHLAISEILAS